MSNNNHHHSNSGAQVPPLPLQQRPPLRRKKRSKESEFELTWKLNSGQQDALRQPQGQLQSHQVLHHGGGAHSTSSMDSLTGHWKLEQSGWPQGDVRSPALIQQERFLTRQTRSLSDSAADPFMPPSPQFLTFLSESGIEDKSTPLRDLRSAPSSPATMFSTLQPSSTSSPPSSTPHTPPSTPFYNTPAASPTHSHFHHHAASVVRDRDGVGIFASSPLSSSSAPEMPLPRTRTRAHSMPQTTNPPFASFILHSVPSSPPTPSTPTSSSPPSSSPSPSPAFFASSSPSFSSSASAPATSTPSSSLPRLPSLSHQHQQHVSHPQHHHYHHSHSQHPHHLHQHPSHPHHHSHHPHHHPSHHSHPHVQFPFSGGPIQLPPLQQQSPVPTSQQQHGNPIIISHQQQHQQQLDSSSEDISELSIRRQLQRTQIHSPMDSESNDAMTMETQQLPSSSSSAPTSQRGSSSNLRRHNGKMDIDFLVSNCSADG
ncbi:Dysfusion, isoform C [Balamuthia mandrillaris]